MTSYQIERVEDYQIDSGMRQQIAGLLQRCFPGYPPGQTYFKQLPAFRYLALQNGVLIGHLAVEHRMMKIGPILARVFGVCDLSVDPDFQRMQIGGSLLDILEADARKYALDFIVLLAQLDTFYEKKGYQPADNPCRWLFIQNHEAIGLVSRKLPNSLLYKPLGDKKWGQGLVDFLGYMF